MDSSNSSEIRYVSTAQVADALGVSVTTVKRWVDEGILPAHRTAGGHRKLLMADVLRAVRDGNFPQADLGKLIVRPPSRLPTEPSAILSQLIEAFRAFDVDLIRSTIFGAYQSGHTIEVLADQILSPALREVGHAWQKGQLDVSHEHRITQACVASLYELRSVIRTNAERERPVAIGGAPEHDHYLLPSLLAKLTLIECGWDAINLGPHTPASAFCTAIDELQPQLVWYSVAHIADVPQFLREYQTVYQHANDRGIPVAIGGRALHESIRGQMLYTTFGDGLTQLSAFARSIHRHPQRPKRGRPPGGGGKDQPAKPNPDGESLN